MSLKSHVALSLMVAFAAAGCASVAEREKPKPLQEFKSLTSEARLAFWECVAIKTVDPDMEEVNRLRNKLIAEGEKNWNDDKEQKFREVLANVRCAQKMGIDPDTVPGLQ